MLSFSYKDLIKWATLDWKNALKKERHFQNTEYWHQNKSKQIFLKLDVSCSILMGFQELVSN